MFVESGQGRWLRETCNHWMYIGNIKATIIVIVYSGTPTGHDKVSRLMGCPP